MTRVHWIDASGLRHTAEVENGVTLMDAAQTAKVPGISGDCGGCLSCATCHVVVDAAWTSVVPPPVAESVEDFMLDAVAGARQANSRLSCQLVAGDALDGLILHVPPA